MSGCAGKRGSRYYVVTRRVASALALVGARCLREVARRAAALWFAGLALLVAGPLLGGGYLLLLDFPSGPQFPQLPPGPGELDNSLPLLAAHRMLGEIGSFLPDKVFLLAPVLVGGIGVHRLARGVLGVGAGPALYAGTLYVLNPFVLDRYLAGHLYLLLGYGILPWAVPSVLALARRPTIRAGGAVALWLAALAVVSVHVAGAYALLGGGALLLGRGRPRVRVAIGALTLTLAAVLSSYWLVPALAAQPQELLPRDVETFASRPRGLAVVPSLAALEGFWRDEFPRATAEAPWLYVLVLPILGLAGLGTAALARRRRRLAAGLSLMALLSILLAASTALPFTASTMGWAFAHVPGLAVYREPQKLLALAVLAFALLGAAGLEALSRTAPGRLSPALTAAAVLAVVLYGHAQLWGFGGKVALVSYPEAWSRAERAMAAKGEGALLLLPWRLYAVWSFSDGRIVANPAPSFFARRVITPDNEQGRTLSGTTHAVERLLYRGARLRPLGSDLARLDVRFVALTHEADWWRYRFLVDRDELVPIFRDRSLTVFENRGWRLRGPSTSFSRSARPAVRIAPVGASGSPGAAP